jgi:WD40 repeat protein/serine/threonine protein kinase
MAAIEATSDRDPFDRLAEEFADRLRRGEHPSVTEYVERYPDCAEAIRDLFPALLVMEQLKVGTRDVTPGARVEPDSACGQAPERLGDFRILRKIGEGGMGVVYEAVQESLGRHVALKVLPSLGPTGSSRLERFRLEARSAARLHHSNIVPVFGVGECNGVHYYAMQYIAGVGLDVVLRDLRRIRNQANAEPCADETRSMTISVAAAHGLLSGPQTAGAPPDESTSNTATHADRTGAGFVAPGNAPSDGSTTGILSNSGSELSNQFDTRYYRSAARVALQVAEALAYAHAQGVLHRDIKPSNLLLDASGNVWVTDFGLAKADEDGPTRTGDIVGTLRYMAPERFRGESDPRNDVYGLGATLYELLTLCPAFDQKDGLGLIMQVTRKDPRAPRSVDGRIPRDLDTIVRKAMAKEPSARYPSAGALAEDLRRFLADRPILARRVGPSERIWRSCKRNPALASMAAAMAMVLGTCAIVACVAAFRFREQRDRVRAEKRRAEQAEREKTNLLRESYLEQARARRWSGRAGRRFESLDALAKAAAIRPASDLRNEAIACMTLPDLRPGQSWAGSPSRAVSLGFDAPFERYARLDPQGVISVRSVASDEELVRLPIDGSGPKRLVFSPDGRCLAVAPFDRARLVVWELASRRALYEVPAGSASRPLSWSPDGRRIAIVDGRNGKIGIVEVDTGREISSLDRVPRVHDLAFAPDGRRLAVTREDSSVLRIYDTLDGTFWEQLHPATVYAAAWRPDGRLLATACADRLIHIVNTDERREVATLAGHLSEVTRVTYNHSGDLLASYGWDNMVRLWDAHTGTLQASVPAIGWEDVKFSLDDRRLACDIDGKWIRLWDVAPGSECRTLHGHQGPGKGPLALEFHPDGWLLASGCCDGVRLWDSLHGRELARLPQQYAESILFEPDGKGLVEYSRAGVSHWPIRPDPGGTAGGFTIGPPRKIVTLASHSRDDRLAWIRPGKTFAASHASSARVLVVDVSSANKPPELKIDSKQSQISLSPEGHWMATGGARYGGVSVWDLQRRVCVKSWNGLRARTAFSPDGRWLVTGSPSAYQFWETGTWRRGLEVPRDRPTLMGLMAFSADGSMLAVAHSTREVHLIDPATGSLLAALAAPNPQLISCLAFSQDGSRLAVANEDHTVQLWDLGQIRRQLAELGLDWDPPSSPGQGMGLDDRPLARFRVKLSSSSELSGRGARLRTKAARARRLTP